MRICVLNGSPKGESSITLQTVLYLQKRFPEHNFHILHVGRRIKAYEKDMTEALYEISQSELLLFCYPVYTFIAPYQLHRFLELLKASGAETRGKYAAQLTTSKHFYDVTAHRYIEDNCLDMGLSYLGGLSADMDDLLSEQGRHEALSFFRYTLHCMENGVCRRLPEAAQKPIAPYVSSLREAEKREGYDTVIVTNCEPEDASLQAMIEDFARAYPFPVRVVNIAEYPFAGGCLGCFHCAHDGKCVYKDGFDVFLRERIQTADAIVYAFTIKDHSMGASFKRYDDRQFCNGHRTVTMGMPMGYLVHGDYGAEPNLRMILEGRCEVGHNFLAGVATDAEEIRMLADSLAYALPNQLSLPRNFYGVGGMKIFRDLIWVMRGLMTADHKFYQKHGQYDFPQKKRGTMLKMQLLGALLRSPKINAKMGDKMTEGMLAPYRKVLATDVNSPSAQTALPASARTKSRS